jgi:hypothetical protein
MLDEIEKAPRAGGAFSEFPLHDGAGKPEIKPPRQNTQGKKRGGRTSRQRAIVRLPQDHGGAERVPLSGSAGGSYLGDLTVPVIGRDLVVEAKSRAKDFSQIYSWLEGRDILIIKADRHDALAVLPLRLAAEIAIAAERRKP